MLEHCEAGTVWYGILYGYKGLVLVFALFLSYETRSVKMKQLNDSRLVGMAIYNIVILCVITGPIALMIDNQVNSHFAFIGITIIFVCFLSMALIMVPKLVDIVRHKQTAAASGLNGTFHDTMSTKEEEERFLRLTQENEELKSKISEKERQIDEVKKKIEKMSKEQLDRRRQEVERERAKAAAAAANTGSSGNGNSGTGAGNRPAKKAVRIQEPGKLEPLSPPDPHNANRMRTAADVEVSESYL